MELDPNTNTSAPHLPLKVRVEVGASLCCCCLASTWSVDKYILQSCQSEISHTLRIHSKIAHRRNDAFVQLFYFQTRLWDKIIGDNGLLILKHLVVEFYSEINTQCWCLSWFCFIFCCFTIKWWQHLSLNAQGEWKSMTCYLPAWAFHKQLLCTAEVS